MPKSTLPPCVIKVIGVGGGGSNAVIRMVEHGVKGVEFGIMNTDVQALQRAPEGVTVVELGRKLTGGLGAGGNPAVGKSAAEESIEEIEKLVAGADMVFITAGMGGGTGSGAAAVVAAAAQRAGALTVGVVTKPFGFEGSRRMRQAMESIANLRPNVDGNDAHIYNDIFIMSCSPSCVCLYQLVMSYTPSPTALIAVSNNKLLEFLPDTVPMTEALICADDILRQVSYWCVCVEMIICFVHIYLCV
jgi:cell division protein FtsZ